VYVSASPFLLLPLTELTPSPLKTYCWIDRKKSIEGVFLCDVCGFDLADTEDADGAKGEEDKMTSFNLQTAWIQEGLRKTGEIIVPAYVEISSYLSSVSRWR
jgi:hypothetical protein